MKLIKLEKVTNSYGSEEVVFRGFTGVAYILSSVVLLPLLFLVLCFRTVDAGKVGIMTRFGEVDRTVQSGIALKLPWPIESLHNMDIRVQKEEQEATAATSDLQDATAVLALNYALDGASALKVYKEIGTDYKGRVIIPALQESFKAASAQYNAAELITKRSEVKSKAFEVIKARLEKFGIRVIDLNIVNFSFSPEFAKAIEAKQVAEQDAQKAVYVAQKAKEDAQAEIERAKGQAEAQRLLNTTATDKSLEYKRLEIQEQAIKKWNGAMPNYYGNDGLLFNIPVQQ